MGIEPITKTLQVFFAKSLGTFAPILYYNSPLIPLYIAITKPTVQATITKVIRTSFIDNFLNVFILFFYLGHKDTSSFLNYQIYFFGATSRIRTNDRLITNQLLYQLSYGGIYFNLSKLNFLISLE